MNQHFLSVPVYVRCARTLQRRVESVIRVLLDHTLYDNVLALLVKHWLVLVHLQALQRLRLINRVTELLDHCFAIVEQNVIHRAVLELLSAHFEQLLVTRVRQFCLFRRQALDNLKFTTTKLKIAFKANFDRR